MSIFAETDLVVMPDGPAVAFPAGSSGVKSKPEVAANTSINQNQWQDLCTYILLEIMHVIRYQSHYLTSLHWEVHK